VKEKSDPLNREEKQALRKLRREAELQRGWAALRQAEALLAGNKETGKA
jgi:hypothetical protein